MKQGGGSAPNTTPAGHQRATDIFSRAILEGGVGFPIPDLMQIETIRNSLSPIPDHFGETERLYCDQVLACLIRDRAIDEIVWQLVIRYAHHRAQWDAINAQVMKRKAKGRKSAEYMTGNEQMLAYHGKQCLELEREMIGTPYRRARVNETAQTSFLETLITDGTDGDGGGVVTPFQPLRRVAR